MSIIKITKPPQVDWLHTWQTIDTAPKDGTVILLCGGFLSNGKPVVRTGKWGGVWQVGWKVEALETYQINPTHWMPLPLPYELEQSS